MAIYTGGAHDLWSNRNLSVTKTWVIHPVSGGSFYINTLWGQNSKSSISSYIFIKLISLSSLTQSCIFTGHWLCFKCLTWVLEATRRSKNGLDPQRTHNREVVTSVLSTERSLEVISYCIECYVNNAPMLITRPSKEASKNHSVISIYWQMNG